MDPIWWIVIVIAVLPSVVFAIWLALRDERTTTTDDDAERPPEP